MKRKTFIFVLLLVASLVLTSCKPSDKTDDNTSSVETPAASEDSQTPVPNESESKEDSGEGDADISLLDKALLASIKIKTPDTMTVNYSEVSRFSLFGTEEEAKDTLTTTIQYMDGKNNRKETIDEYGKTISIYNSDDGISYEYVEGETTGYKYEENIIMNNVNFEEYEGKNLLELFEVVIETMSEESEMDMILKAEKDKFAGRKAIRIEFIIPEKVLLSMKESGEDLGMEIDGPLNFITYWIDQEYTAILGLEMNAGGSFYLYQEATDIQFNEKINRDLFVPPSEITFELESW